MSVENTLLIFSILHIMVSSGVPANNGTLIYIKLENYHQE
jgi:hypothetical protein